ncbi:hypothetical protein T492DRAFT_972402 [Pavlovales sp. CCMP2436]|nr:hypothetical protein T492DRAFT_972402 [Pavlovales sp. CCMP2436]|mmetsp:Transcript_36389/g.90783  ORF Transcript_36389/g.90783 Transcript_36389/m.90783 type:complete len:287 (+) Transcript_36389:106-966(+)
MLADARGTPADGSWALPSVMPDARVGQHGLRRAVSLVLVVALTFTMVALFTQPVGAAGVPDFGRHEKPSAASQEPIYCPKDKLHDACRVNTDAKSEHFGQCAQICLKPGLLELAKKHGVQSNSTCFRLGYKTAAGEGDKSGQHVYFFNLTAPEVKSAAKASSEGRHSAPAPALAGAPARNDKHAVLLPTPEPEASKRRGRDEEVAAREKQAVPVPPGPAPSPLTLAAVVNLGSDCVEDTVCSRHRDKELKDRPTELVAAATLTLEPEATPTPVPSGRERGNSQRHD